MIDYIKYEEWLDMMKLGHTGKQTGIKEAEYFWEKDKKYIFRKYDGIYEKTTGITSRSKKEHENYKYWIIFNPEIEQKTIEEIIGEI